MIRVALLASLSAGIAVTAWAQRPCPPGFEPDGDACIQMPQARSEGVAIDDAQTTPLRGALLGPLPVARKGIDYGNYCGPGHTAGKHGSIPEDIDWCVPPVDAMDELCRAHDAGYESYHQADRLAADRTFVAGLEKLSGAKLYPRDPKKATAAERYRLRAMKFFKSLIAVRQEETRRASNNVLRREAKQTKDPVRKALLRNEASYLEESIRRTRAEQEQKTQRLRAARLESQSHCK